MALEIDRVRALAIALCLLNNRVGQPCAARQLSLSLDCLMEKACLQDHYVEKR
jgi:hypothetical protein